MDQVGAMVVVRAGHPVSVRGGDLPAPRPRHGIAEWGHVEEVEVGAAPDLEVQVRQRDDLLESEAQDVYTLDVGETPSAVHGPGTAKS
ncbi:MAG: hypothetical protein U0360_00630 [Dehalococcoidia bacterium]